jgi:hypothetical protein
MSDSMAICVIKHVLDKVEDTEIRAVFELALNLSQSHVEKIKQIFIDEGFPIPHGFTDEDVNLKAPRLFSDSFWLMYINKMSIHGLTGYAVALTTAIRADIRDFYTQVNDSTMELYNKSLNVKLSKGLYVRPPYISTPEKIDFVKKQSFLTGWFGERRPINAVEISHIDVNSHFISSKRQRIFSIFSRLNTILSWINMLNFLHIVRGEFFYGHFS